MKFNLNADMAEGYGPWKMGDDDALLDIIATANIACGFHAGDHNIMGRVMAEARDKKVSIGSHPGFLDLHGFGRRQMKLPFAEIERLMAYQIGASLGMASLVGADVSHVKVHGALSNMACADDELSDAIVKAVHAVAPDLPAETRGTQSGRLPVILHKANIMIQRIYTKGLEAIQV